MFMSSFAIMAIAFDRYRCIMQPDKNQLTVKISCLVSFAMGVLAIGMSIPLFLGTELEEYVRLSKLSDILLCSDVRSGDIRYADCMCIYNYIHTDGAREVCLTIVL